MGGGTEVKIGENRDLIVDALNTARSGMADGIISGGGSSLYHVSKLLPRLMQFKTEDERMGM